MEGFERLMLFGFLLGLGKLSVSF
jgi:hypothetical protein